MPKSNFVTTHPLTRYCNKRLCKPGREKIFDSGSRESYYQKHIANCWAQQGNISVDFLAKIEDANPFLGKSLNTLMSSVSLQEGDFTRFLRGCLLPLSKKRSSTISKIESNLTEITSGSIEMAAHLLLRNNLQSFVKKGLRSFEEMDVVALDPSNLETYKDFARKHTFSNIIVDLEQAKLFSSRAHLAYHWDLVEDILFTGIDLLDGIGIDKAKLKKRFAAISIIAQDEKSIVRAVSCSNLNTGRMRPSDEQKARLIEIIMSLDSTLLHSRF